MSAILRVHDLSLSRSGFLILDHISWQVQPEENWVILGANGSGKTSLLKVLVGYLPPTSGSVSVLDQSFGHSDWHELRKAVGIVSSGIANLMHSEDTALEIVVGGKSATIGSWKGITKAERNSALDLLKSVKIAHLAFKRWELFSQGERQRVLIARALMARPKILILDEPCAGLDPAAREEFLIFLNQQATSAQAIPLLFVTHHVEEVIPCFTHALVLKAGRVLSAGSLSELNSAILSDAFSHNVSLRRKNRRFTLTMEH
ncbi:MAG: ABC transporter [Verrucomicrobia bacterium]|nr:MAG: ABC transporter [Verrucomicrobiota bacterium]